ncbi:hypothetical protein LAZ67_4001059 [Cordylochernes scorpioides]|uniref:Uncharacterized protein n=1 Tax=Cordylochernes scorpioides TaxID=51811 RepID=A0ABY6KCQ6_9ARAC|nr:hypothetical protein LAZ67_4001059 [Cordylochernes scorpioides]
MDPVRELMGHTLRAINLSSLSLKEGDVLEYQSPEQRSVLKQFLDMAIAHVGEKSNLRGTLSNFRAECDIIPDDHQWNSYDENNI